MVDLFFQAEDGIRDIGVTGVQTCALPISAIISVKLEEPQFEGQTKTKLGNTEAKGFVQRVANEQLGAWMERNPAEGKDVVRKAMSAAQARIAARKARELARSRKGLLEIGRASCRERV